jgi:molecular chaperone DnaK (HSP70)
MTYPIGIDLGTTNSVACVWRRGSIETIPVDGRATMPSAISVRQDGTVLIGQAAKSRAMLEPTQSVTSAKRSIGDGKTQWQIDNKSYTPVDVSALALRRLKAAAESFLGEPVTEAVITVPAYFNNNQKRDTKLAGEAAGLRVLQLLPEPTAAAISYGLDKGKDQTILVYDLGGGTFDVSVLTVKGNQFQVVAVDGDFNLGGDDFDLLLVEHLISLLQKRSNANLDLLDSLLRHLQGTQDLNDPREILVARQRLKEAAEKAKIELSESESARVTLPEILGTSLDEEITLETYNSLIEPLVEKTITKIQAVLKASRLTAEDIDRVILVGGSTRNKLVRQRISSEIKEPFISERVDEVVAQGAAIVAGYLFSPQEDITPIEFHNVTPFSLGICAYKGEDRSRFINSIIIQKNSPVPCVESKPYQLRTRREQNNQLDVYMLQGESEDPGKCLVLGKYIFSHITHVPGIPARINIEYGYDESGMITVAAIEKSTGKALPLTIELLPDDMSWLTGNLNSQQSDSKSPYTIHAGQQRIPGAVTDQYGNPLGTQYDLIENNAFADCLIAVLHLYTSEGFDFKLPEAALKEKGFKIKRWTSVPGIHEFTQTLDDACQLWLISNTTQLLSSEHLGKISEFFDSGRGIYIWGDNDPYYADANYVSNAIFGCGMSGDTMGDQVVNPQIQSGKPGFVSHLITTGLQYLYEGVTVATIKSNSQLQPLVYGSAGNLVTAIYDQDGKRAIIDGGFTKLFCKWDTAGTGRYVKNAAGWLVNYERFWR